MSDDRAEIAILASSATLGGVAVIGRTGEDDKLVLVGPYDPCGECDVCRRGGAAVCPTRTSHDAVGSHVRAASRYVVPIEGGLELPVPAGAVVAGDVTLAYTLYARTGPAPRDPVVLVGASPVARFLVEILRAKGITPIVVTEPAPWCDWLRAKGAVVAHDAEAVTSAITAQGSTARAPRVIAVSSDPQTIERAAALTGPRSTLTVLAPIASLPGVLAAREVTVIPVAGPHPDLVVEAAAMCTKGEVDVVGNTSLVADAEHRALIRPR